jgi:hypothetical protein
LARRGCAPKDAVESHLGQSPPSLPCTHPVLSPTWTWLGYGNIDANDPNVAFCRAASFRIEVSSWPKGEYPLQWGLGGISGDVRSQTELASLAMRRNDKASSEESVAPWLVLPNSIPNDLSRPAPAILVSISSLPSGPSQSRNRAELVITFRCRRTVNRTHSSAESDALNLVK